MLFADSSSDSSSTSSLHDQRLNNISSDSSSTNGSNRKYFTSDSSSSSSSGHSCRTSSSRPGYLAYYLDSTATTSGSSVASSTTSKSSSERISAPELRQILRRAAARRGRTLDVSEQTRGLSLRTYWNESKLNMEGVVLDRKGNLYHGIRGELQLSTYVNYGLLTIHIKKIRRLQHKVSTANDVVSTFVTVSISPSETSVPLCSTDEVRSLKGDPVFDEKFSFEMVPEDMDKRLVVTVHRRHCRQVSEVIGSMSFGISRIQQQSISGWFYLLADDIGQLKHRRAGRRKATSNGRRKKRRKLPNNMPTLTTKRIKIILEVEANSSRQFERGFQISGSSPVSVVQVRDGSDASRSGLKVGDRIISIDGLDVSMSSAEVVARLIRYAGSKPVALEVLRSEFLLNDSRHKVLWTDIQLTSEMHKDTTERRRPATDATAADTAHLAAPETGNPTIIFRRNSHQVKEGRTVAGKPFSNEQLHVRRSVALRQSSAGDGTGSLTSLPPPAATSAVASELLTAEAPPEKSDGTGVSASVSAVGRGTTTRRPFTIRRRYRETLVYSTNSNPVARPDDRRLPTDPDSKETLTSKVGDNELAEKYDAPTVIELDHSPRRVQPSSRRSTLSPSTSSPIPPPLPPLRCRSIVGNSAWRSEKSLHVLDVGSAAKLSAHQHSKSMSTGLSVDTGERSVSAAATTTTRKTSSGLYERIEDCISKSTSILDCSTPSVANVANRRRTPPVHSAERQWRRHRIASGGAPSAPSYQTTPNAAVATNSVVHRDDAGIYEPMSRFAAATSTPAVAGDGVTDDCLERRTNVVLGACGNGESHYVDMSAQWAKKTLLKQSSTVEMSDRISCPQTETSAAIEQPPKNSRCDEMQTSDHPACVDINTAGKDYDQLNDIYVLALQPSPSSACDDSSTPAVVQKPPIEPAAVDSVSSNHSMLDPFGILQFAGGNTSGSRSGFYSRSPSGSNTTAVNDDAHYDVIISSREHVGKASAKDDAKASKKKVPRKSKRSAFKEFLSGNISKLL